MKKTHLTLTLTVVLLLSIWNCPAQTRQMEKLNRGLVAMKTAENTVFIDWRFLGSDQKDLAFNIYRVTGKCAPEKLNAEPLTGATNFLDKTADIKQDLTYSVKPVMNGKEQEAEGHFCIKAGSTPKQYLSIPLRTPDRYTPNDCSVGDLDGDGEYEVVVHMSGVGRDNGQAGVTTVPIFQAYKLDGTFLWEINLGINIREGAHYTQFLVYDFDGDGKAEMICKTADGTVDGIGKRIGDTTDWRGKTADGIMDPWKGRTMGFNRSNFNRNAVVTDSMRRVYRAQRDSIQKSGQRQKNFSMAGMVGRILKGPEYLTVFDGKTGKALATENYVPGRGLDENLWGDNHGNRSERYLAGVAYLDGKRPSAVMCRGYYTRATLAAWDWRDGKLTQRWLFDSYDGTPGNNKFSGQGNHSLTVADVDQDGADEIVYGSCVIDNNGKGLYATGYGHGDAMHCSDLDPDRPGLEVFQVHEDMRHGGDVAAGDFRDAKTGKLIWGIPARNGDVGRGMCADLDPRYPGYECWSVASGGLHTAKGVKITENHPRSCNFGIWWDGDLSRELLDRNNIYKWNWLDEKDSLIFRADSCSSNNGTKSTPALSVDLFGDWREEVILRTLDNKELRIFTTTIPTDYRMTTLMHDSQYRLSIAWQNVAYNQPPYPGFFLGNGMKAIDIPGFYAPAGK